MDAQALDFKLNDSILVIKLPESMDINSTANLWAPAMELVDKEKPNEIQIDASQTQYCDSAGTAFLIELRKKQSNTQISGLTEHCKELLNRFSELPEPDIDKRPPPSQFVRIGKYSYGFLHRIYENFGFIGEMSYYFVKSIRHPSSVRWGDFWRFIERVGPNAMPLAALLGFILGVILSFQALVSLKPYGAEIYTVNLVNISLTRELAPLMTGIILAGRTASAFTAELGTMKINQEIDALNTMGLGPIGFLVVPRVLATIIMTPIINLYIIIFGYLGCFLVVASALHSFSIFYTQLIASFVFSNFITGMIKAFIFGILIGSIGCIRGLKTKNRATAVGESTTKAVVSSIVMLGIADGLLTFIYYIIGK